MLELRVGPESQGERLDRWLVAELAGEASRSQIQKWIEEGGVELIEPGEGEELTEEFPRASRKTIAGELYRLEIPEPVQTDLRPLDQNLRVLHEDEDLAVIVKPPGLAVHPGPGDGGVTLVNGLLYLFGELPNSGELIRPGIVHRLDKPTEGLLVVARNEKTQRLLSLQFQERTVRKEYLAWLLAAPREKRGRIEQPLERHPKERLKMRVAAPGRGREAVSEYEITRAVASRRGRKFAQARVRIETGRTHQIRVHLAHLGSPVVGDPLYSRSSVKYEKFGLLLLARKLRFVHPRTGEELAFELEIPERFLEFERRCENF